MQVPLGWSQAASVSEGTPRHLQDRWLRLAPPGANWSSSPRLWILPAPPRNSLSQKTPCLLCPSGELKILHGGQQVFFFQNYDDSLHLSHFPCFCGCQDPASSCGSARLCLSPKLSAADTVSLCLLASP